MNLNSKDLDLLLQGLIQLEGNNANWELQERIINQLSYLEMYDKRKRELTGFKELDNPECP